MIETTRAKEIKDSISFSASGNYITLNFKTTSSSNGKAQWYFNAQIKDGFFLVTEEHIRSLASFIDTYLGIVE